MSENITLGIHMLAKDAGSCITRALASVHPYATELVLVDDCSSDDTVQVAKDWCGVNDVAFKPVIITPETHPQLYMLDVAETFEPLAGCTLPQVFSGKTLLCNFGGARNIGWGAATTSWILWLDADDVVDNADKIPGSIIAAKTRGIKQVYAKYNDDAVRASFTERGAAVWIGAVHESLSKIDGALSVVSVRDMHDSRRERIHGHYLKAAWLACQRLGIEQADVNDIASIVQDLFWMGSPSFRPMLEVLRRRAPGSPVLKFVEEAIK